MNQKPLKCVARPYSSSPAVGYLSLHEEQQKKIISEALDFEEGALPKRKRCLSGCYTNVWRSKCY